jgi:hypothetical protein
MKTTYIATIAGLHGANDITIAFKLEEVEDRGYIWNYSPKAVKAKARRLDPNLPPCVYHPDDTCCKYHDIPPYAGSGGNGYGARLFTDRDKAVEHLRSFAVSLKGNELKRWLGIDAMASKISTDDLNEKIVSDFELLLARANHNSPFKKPITARWIEQQAEIWEGKGYPPSATFVVDGQLFRVEKCDGKFIYAHNWGHN